MASESLGIVPGHSLGFMSLGVSLREVLAIIKEDRERYPALDLHFSQSDPLSTPVIVTLPQNGIRLRFDARDQRLRLIEVLDFRKARLAYKGSELVKNHDGGSASFKRIYQLFGASYPGEYIPPKTGNTGVYVLSWEGVAFNFPLQQSAWAPEKDHVSLLGSHAASPATHMALFEGKSWSDARNDLFIRTPTGPRMSAINAQPKDSLPAELESAVIQDAGKVTLIRRAPSQPFDIVLGQTTPQDLITELGAPDATHKREILPITDNLPDLRPRSTSKGTTNGRHHPTPPSSYSSTGTDTFDTDFDSGSAEDDPAERANREIFWSYFSHGLDILVGPPGEQHPERDLDSNHPSTSKPPLTPMSASPHLVVLKLVIHGNIPGSYAFNRHRRLQWTLTPARSSETLCSEHSFDEIKPDLLQAFHGIWPESEMGRGKVVNRTWGADDPSDSSFYLPDADEDLVEGGGVGDADAATTVGPSTTAAGFAFSPGSSEHWLGNTKLYSFPGLTFEVLSNGAVAGVTVS